MATYILTWNPARWEWHDLKRCIKNVEIKGFCNYTWSCGITKKIHPNDRVFLIKLGKEPRGIVASGWVISEVYEDEHWDEKARDKGKKALYVNVCFDEILDPEKKIFHRERLKGGIYEKMHWEPQASGVRIPDDVAEQLEKDWSKFLNRSVDKRVITKKKVTFAEEAEVDSTYHEGAPKQIVVNAYERSEGARLACIRHYGFKCSVCNFSFEEVYGTIGEGFIHVHHIKPLSEIGKNYKLNPIRDLRPVCPNCHAMLHQRDPAYTIRELKAILKRREKRRQE